MARPLLLGHRGARKYAPENTSDAFMYALQDGCDGFEFDVRLTSDLLPVVCHDPKIFGLEVAKSTYRELFDASSRRRAEIPALEEVLGFGDRAFLNLELKVMGTEQIVLDLVKKDAPERGFVLSSFLPEVLTRVHELSGSYQLGLICDSRRQLERWKSLPIQAVMVNRGLLSATLVDELHAAEKQVFVWTVNNASEMKKFAEWGVDGIISDDTKLLAEVIGR